MSGAYNFKSKFKPGQTVRIADGEIRGRVENIAFWLGCSELMIRVMWWADGELKHVNLLESEVHHEEL